METSRPIPSHSADSKSHVSSAIVLTATLAIAGTVIPVALSEAGTTAERIQAIHSAVESGVIKLVNSSDGSPVQVPEDGFNKAKKPIPPP